MIFFETRVETKSICKILFKTNWLKLKLKIKFNFKKIYKQKIKILKVFVIALSKLFLKIYFKN